VHVLGRMVVKAARGKRQRAKGGRRAGSQEKGAIAAVLESEGGQKN